MKTGIQKQILQVLFLKIILKLVKLLKDLLQKLRSVSSIEVNSFDAFLNLSSSSRFENGWKSNAGVLNDNIQRIQDSLYYQNFSYSIKSRVDFDIWNDTVSTLNHTSGFKKFSDYQLESNLSVETSNSLVVKLAFRFNFS